MRCPYCVSDIADEALACPNCTRDLYLFKPLLERIKNGEIDPSFVITHRMRLDDAPEGYDIFLNKQDDCVKVG